MVESTLGVPYYFKAKPICLKILRGLHIQSLELSGQLCGMFDLHFQATPHLDSGLEKVEFPDKRGAVVECWNLLDIETY